MKTVRISLIDNDHVVQAMNDLDLNDSAGSSVATFFQKIREELVTGETAYIEVNGLQKDPMTFAISQME